MKILKSALFGVLALSATVLGQTTDLGQSVFSSNQGEIVMTIDAALAVRKLDSPYVMFMAYLVVMGGQNVTVNRDDVTMTYNGQEYKMPSLKEWRDKYNGALGDVVSTRWVKESGSFPFEGIQFPLGPGFFPRPGPGPAADGPGLHGRHGRVQDQALLKNPGFKKGEQLVISVKDRKDPEVFGSCAVILK